MSSLTKKLLFFGVFSIVCNLTTADCIANLGTMFYDKVTPYETFLVAMTALSETQIINLSRNYKPVYDFFTKYHSTVDDIDNEIFNKKQEKVLHYFYNVAEKQDNEASSSKYEEFSSSKEDDLLGYFESFTNRITSLSDIINKKVHSPRQYCGGIEDIVYIDSFKCHNALWTMFHLRDPDVFIQGHKMWNFTATQAFLYSYQNYTYLDFTIENMFPDTASYSVGMTSKDKKYQVGMMMGYFSYLLEESSTLKEIEKGIVPEPFISRLFKKSTQEDKPVILPFLTIDEYCETA